MAALEKELLDSLVALDADQRRQVLEYARALRTTPEHGVPGRSLLRFAGMMSEEEAQEIRDAIAEGCESVDLRGWRLPPRHERHHRPVRR